MTEEIIIDGVNVAGCEYYCLEYDGCFCFNSNDEIYDTPPKSQHKCNNNCYYKQLKRLELEHNTICYNLGLLEQENEKLKKEVKQIGSDFIKKGDYARELEKENKELKKQIESQKGLITVGGKQQYQYLQRIDELELENKELKEEKLYRGIDRQFIEDANDRLYFEEEKYRKALEEINTLIDKLDGLECIYSDYNCDNCSSLVEETVCTYKLHKIIKDKINEVLQ